MCWCLLSYIYLPVLVQEKLLETLAADVDFLTRHEIMDYSLLLGIHDTEREDDREEPEEEEDEEEYDSGGSGAPALTPPDSPGQIASVFRSPVFI
jgi:1-phosphatidylinositol-5-phosphate 4-kinase